MEKVELNKEIKLTPHFTLGELTKTKYVTADGNIPSRVVIENLIRVCGNWLEDLRYSYNTLYCLQPGEDYETNLGRIMRRPKTLSRLSSTLVTVHLR